MMSGMISGLLHPSWSLWWGHPGNFVNKYNRQTLTDTGYIGILKVQQVTIAQTDQTTLLGLLFVTRLCPWRSWRYVSLMHASHRQCLLVLGEFKPVWFYFVYRVRALKWNTMIRLNPPKIEDNNTIKSSWGFKCKLRDNKAPKRNVFHF